MGINRLLFRVGFVFVWCALIPSYAQAVVIYSNLDPDVTFVANISYFSNYDAVQFLGTSFVASGPGELSQILAPVSGPEFPVGFGLYSDTAGEPGNLLESWLVQLPEYTEFPSSVYTFVSVNHPSLSAGDSYWFVADPSGIAWSANNLGILGGASVGGSFNALSNGGEVLNPTPAIELDSLPEPSSILVIGGAACGLRLRSRRR